MAVSDPNEPGKLATASFLGLMLMATWLWVGAIWAIVFMMRG
jgi:hypothetical protein